MSQSFFDLLVDGAAQSIESAPRGGAGDNVAAFVQENLPLARGVASRIGVDPQVLLGQWGLETGWGRSVIPGTNNLGNIKDTSGAGPKATDNQTGSRDSYRQYASADEFGQDFAGLIGRRYRAAMGAGDDANRFFSELKRGGYAEDADYVRKGVAATDMVRRAMGGDNARPYIEPRNTDFVGELPPIPERSVTEALADAGIGFASGVVDGVGMVAGVAGADNAVSRGAREISDDLRSKQSPARQAQRRLRADIIAAAEDSGSTWEEIKAYAGALAEAPGETILNAVGTSAPTLLVALIPGLNTATAARLVVQGAIGAAQGAGAVKGSIHDAVERKLIEEGVSPSEAAKVAAAAQAYDGPNKQQILIGLGLGTLAATTGAEKAIGSIVGRKAGAEAAERGVMARTAGGMAAEAPVEAAQGGQERVASNIALQNEGYDVPTFQGAAGQAVLEGMASAPLGGAAGAIDSGKPAAAAPVAPPVPPQLADVAAKASEPNSPLSKAALSGAAAQQAIAPPPAAPQVDPLTQRARAIQDQARASGLLDALRAEGSPVDAKRFLDDLAVASSESTPAHQREQALTRLEFAAGWAEQNAPARPAAMPDEIGGTVGGERPQGPAPTLEQKRTAADRDAQMQAQLAAATTEFERQQIRAQMATNLEHRLRAPAAEPTQAGSDPAQDGQAVQDGQARLEAAALAGKDANRRTEDEPRQIVIDRALRNVEERGGVASPQEAQIFAEAGIGRPYDRIDESLAPAPELALPRMAEPPQPQGLVVEGRPSQRDPNRLERVRSSVEMTETEPFTLRRDTEPGAAPAPANVETLDAAGLYDTGDLALQPVPSATDEANDASMRAQAERRERERADRDATLQQQIADSAKAAPVDVDAVIAALKPAPFQRTADQKATIDRATRTLTAEQMRVLRDAAQQPAALSATDRLQLQQLRDVKRSAERSEQAGATGGAASPAPQENVSRETVDTRVPAYLRRRRATLEQLADNGYDVVERMADGFVLRNSKTGRVFRLDGAADAQLARAAAGRRIDRLAHEAASSPSNGLAQPTEAQIRAENYKKGHLSFQGLDIAIENPKGSTRSGTAPDGTRWESTMHSHYGYVKRTEGADGDAVDVFIGPRADSPRVYVIDQRNEDGSFDEHKVMLGFTSEQAAREGYLANYDEGWTGLGAITEMSMDEFKAWLKTPATTQAAAQRPDVAAVAVAAAGPGSTFTVRDGGEDVTLVRADISALPKTSSAGREGRRHQLTQDELAALDRIAAIFGKRVEIFSDPSGAIGDGFVDPRDPDAIYVNEQTSISPLSVLGHELMHLLRLQNPQAYAAIAKVVSRRVSNAQGFRVDYFGAEEAAARGDAPLEAAELEELVSDLNGNLMRDPSFWREVLDQVAEDNSPAEARGIVARLQAFVDYWLDRAIDLFKGQRGFSAGRFVTDAKAIREAVRDGMAAFIKDAGVSQSAMAGELLKAKKSTERDMGAFRKNLLDDVKARVEYAQLLSRQHDWAFNVGDTFMSTHTGKTYRITGRTFTKTGERITKGNPGKLVPTYFYESGTPPPAGAAQAEQDAWQGAWERGSFREDRLLESKTMKNLTTPRPMKFSRERVVGGDVGDYIFHVTPSRNVAKILREGLTPKIGPRSRSAGEPAPKTYFFTSVEALEDGFLGWLDEAFDEETRLAVLAVRRDAAPDLVVDDGVEYEGTTASAVPPDDIIVVTRDVDSIEDLKTAVDSAIKGASSDAGIAKSATRYTDGPTKTAREEDADTAADRSASASPAGQAAGEDRARAGGERPDAAGSGDGGAAQRADVRPDRQRASYGEPRDGAVSAVGVHFSTQPRERLSAAYYGRGLKGAERARLEGRQNADIRPRIFFYVDRGQGIRPEFGVGPHAHEVLLENLYDVGADPLGLVRGVRHADAGERANLMERAILEAGFDGYVHLPPDMPQGFAVLVGGKHAAVPVTPVSRAAIEPPAPAAPQTTKKGLLSKEAGAIDVSRIPGAKLRMGTLEVPAASHEAANAELERIGSQIRFSRERLETPAEQYAAVEKKYKGTDAWMKAPNGVPTLLTERQWVHVRTPSFKKWFGDWEAFAGREGGVWADEKGEVSKAVGANGEPLVLYHGTSSGGFAKFQGASGTKRGNLGIFLTDNWDMASTYARRGRKTDIDAGTLADYEVDEEPVNGVYALFANIREPNEADFEGANWDGQRTGQWVVNAGGEIQYDAEGRQFFSEEEALEFAKTFVAPDDENTDPADFLRAAEDHYETTDGVVAEAHRHGQDGAVIREVVDDGGAASFYAGEPADIFVAFSPDQVKSADFNIGTYEINDDDIRFSRARRLARVDPFEVSTRAPSAKPNKKFTPEDPVAGLLISDFRAGRDQAGWMEAVAALVEQYPNYREAKSATTPEKKLERLVRQMTDSLIWLHDQVPAATRERSKKWYDGARAIAERMAKKYDISEAQAAGIMAVLSPQKDWFMNVSLADRVAQVLAERQAFRWSRQMDETADRIFAGAAYQDDVAAIRGSTLADIEDDYLRAMWLRVYDEAHNPRSFWIVSPEGDSLAEARTIGGELAKPAWGGISTIAKGVSIYGDGSFENINAQLGRKHKVRNFYNNILVPNSPNGHVTIDTHAVAAALLRPLSGNSTEVMHNFGGPKSAHAGLEGTYALYEEAYHRAAKELGLLPRELQSITWEAVRGLFTPGFKSQARNVEAINRIWTQHKKGRLSYEHARLETLEAAGGIEPPGWAGRDPGAYAEDEPAADDRDVRLDGAPGQGAGATESGGAGGDSGAAAGEASDGAAAGNGDAVKRSAERPAVVAAGADEGRSDRVAGATRVFAESGRGDRQPAVLDGRPADAIASYFDGDRLVAHEIDDASAFLSLITEAKREHPRGELVHAYTADEYADMRLFVTPDGLAGVGVKRDGDVVSLFKNPRAGGFTKHAFDLMKLATQEGGIKEDVFDIGIPDFDARLGFRAVARVKWSDEAAPAGWSKQKYAASNGGEPDVVFLVYDPERVLGEFRSYSRDIKPTLPYSEYDEAVALQQQAVERIRGGGIAKSTQRGTTRRQFLAGMGAAAALASTNASAGTTLGRAKPISESVMSKAVTPAAAKILRGNGATNANGAKATAAALKEIAANGPGEVRPLAAAIAKLLPSDGFMLTVHDKGRWNVHGAVELGPVVHLHLMAGEGHTGLSYGTFLHEVLHVAVAARYRDLSSGLVRSNDAVLKRPAPKAAKELEQFHRVWREFREVAAKAVSIDDKELSTSIAEARRSPDEFFVRAMTEPSLQQWMASKKYEGKTLWDRFKDWVKTSLFGMRNEGIEASWLDAALAATDDLSSAMLRDAADFDRLRAVDAVSRTQASQNSIAEGGVTKSTARQTAWYSQLERAITQVPPRISTMSAPQWAQWIKANASKHGVKQDEITWSGIEDYLKLRGKDKISADELAAWVGENGVKVEEVVLGGERPAKNARAPKSALNAESIRQFGYEYDGLTYREQRAVRDVVEKASAEYIEPKYGEYTLPGGENYRELLLTLPPAGEKYFQFVIKEGGGRAYRFNGVEYATESEARSAEQAARRSEYKSNHWEAPNVLAHIRFNERTDAEGKRVLFVEELQSDWNAEGRKKGFARDAMAVRVERARALEKLQDEIRREAREKFGGSALTRSYANLALDLGRADELRAAQDAVAQARDEPGPPLAPFVTDTKSWLSLALKRAIKWAVDNDFDRVAFTTGEQNANRYDLSKQISELIVFRPGDDEFDLFADATSGTLNEQGLSSSKLADTIGKELAEKAAKIPVGERRVFSGVDLKVGGEGMRTFYDKIVPQVANDVLKKLGGGKVGEVRFVRTRSKSLKAAMSDYWGTLNREYDRVLPELEKIYEASSEEGKARLAAMDESFGVYTGRFSTQPGVDGDPEPFITWARDNVPGAFPSFGNVELRGRRWKEEKIQPGFDITPKMREQVSGGMPLFSRYRENPELTAWAEGALSGRYMKEPAHLVTRKLPHASLAMAGLDPDLPVIVDVRLTKHIRTAGHAEVSPQMVGRLADLMANPRAVIRNVDKGGIERHQMLVDARDRDGNPILVALRQSELTHARKSIDVYDVRTMFGREESMRYILDQLRRGNVVWMADKEIAAVRDFTDGGTVPRAGSAGAQPKGAATASSVAGDAALKRFAAGDKSWKKHTVELAIPADALDDAKGVKFSRERAADDDTDPTPPPNGGPKGGKPKRDVTDTPAFKKWFGDSKVVDADGKPLVVYHGTNRDFAEFDKAAIGANFPNVSRAFYFSATPSGALSYALDPAGAQLARPGIPGIFMGSPADAGAGGSNIMPVYLRISSPLRKTALGNFSPEQWLDKHRERLLEQARAGAHDGIVIEPGRLFGDRGAVYAVLEPEQIKSAVGNDGNFDPTSPDITKSAARSFETPSQSRFDDLVYKLQDKHVDTKRVTEAIKEAGGAIRDDLDVYLQEELFHGRAAKRTEDFVDLELQPLVKDMAARGLTIGELDEYLHARHAREANAVIAARNPELQDGGSGLLNQDAEAYFAELPAAKREALEAAAAKVDAMIRGTNKLLVDYELESGETVKGWGEMFQHYVPLMREDDGRHAGNGTGQGFSIKGREVKSRTGSTRKVVDILANIAMQRERTIVRGEKNRVARALFGLAAANDNPDFWKVDTHVPTEQVFNAKTGKVEDRPDNLYKQRPNVVTAKFIGGDGKLYERAVVFNEKDERAMRMAEALKNLDAAQLEGLLGASASVTRYFASVNTQYNPVFGIVNLVRDVQGALVNLQSTPLAGEQKAIARNTLPALRGIYADTRAARKGKQPSSAWATLWDEFQEVGGQTGFRQLFQTSADRAQKIEQALDPDKWTESRLGKIFTANGALKVPMAAAVRGARWIFDWLSDYNLAMENGIRLAAYKAGLDKGLSKERAASIAKNLTVNFNRKGQAAQQAGALYAFFNASAQGTARLGQVLFDMEPGKPKTIRLSALGKKVVYGGMLLGSMQALAMAAAGFSDDDPPDFVRERSLIIPVGGKKYISIPMPLGLHVIPNLGRIPTEWALSGFKDTPKRAVSVVALFADAFNPIGNAGLSMQTLAPTALDPLVALTENKDWSGRPIAKESMNRAVPGHALARDTATTVSRVLSEAINYLSGGTKHTAGVISPTPDQIDYLIGQVTGGVGREISKVEQTVTSAVHGEAMPTYKVPLVGRFVGNAASQASEGAAFYANVNRLNELETEIKGLRKDGDLAAANELRMRNPEAYLITAANAAERRVQKLRRQKSEMIKAGAPRAEVKAIEERITAEMARLNRAAERLRERAEAD